MIELITGSGLAASAGLNAYIPMLLLGLLSRFTDFVTMPEGWEWIQSTPALIIVSVLLLFEIVADKVPAVDSINDIVQTVIRPASGGIVFAAGANSTTLEDPSTLTDSNVWIPIAIGVVMALITHTGKTLGRPAVNVATAGIGAPVASTVEDVVSVTMSLTALFLPLLALILLLALFGGAIYWLRKHRPTLPKWLARANNAQDQSVA